MFKFKRKQNNWLCLSQHKHIFLLDPKDRIDIGLPPPRVIRTQQLQERKHFIRELRANVEEERAARLRTGEPPRRGVPGACSSHCIQTILFLSQHPTGRSAGRVGEDQWSLPQEASGGVLWPLPRPVPRCHFCAQGPPSRGLRCGRRGPDPGVSWQ